MESATYFTIVNALPGCGIPLFGKSCTPLNQTWSTLSVLPPLVRWTWHFTVSLSLLFHKI
jgi:hypothetical protein